MHEYPAPPPLDAFGPFRIPDGREWRFGDLDHPTHDNGCVAMAEHPDGWVAVADTKNPLKEPHIYNEREWAAFCAVIVARHQQNAA
ncbi:DUF397 domain-containing protein [Longispora sp. K20-0274]|uniref:DUF397 domain-containing protein n=1 Tax=Longispora sp. K20-0274 TaxID=3088255 RepID=UPI003999C037